MNALLKRLMSTLATVAAACGAVPGHAAIPNEQFFPVLVFRTGAYAPNGVPWANGFVDYLNLVNERDGGIGGVKITYEECETGYSTDRGVECYERLKGKGPTGATSFNPLSTGITFALGDKVAADRIPLITMGYGRSESTDGSVFKWNFPLLGTYWDAADMLVQHVAAREGGMPKLRGRKIALLYHDSPYGKEPIPVLQALSHRLGFEFIAIPVAHPGVEQKAAWLQIRQARPDHVFVWGWGVMNSTAINEAIAVNYPRDRMYGVWWAGAEPDVLPAQAAAAGYNALTLQHSADQRRVHDDIRRYVYGRGKGAGEASAVGQVLYNRGLLNALLVVEAVRTAQGRHGRRPLTGEQVRWGVEHLAIDAARIAALGIDGMLQPLHTSCADHEGAHRARIHSWNGTAWQYTSDWYESDRALLGPMMAVAAKKYAADKGLPVRDCSQEG
jgi:branched-chain amino acid transport system substrate-binding protein